MNRSGVRFPQVAPSVAIGAPLWGASTVSRSRTRSRVSGEHLARDPACGVAGREAGVAAGVVDDFGDLVLRQPVVAGDLHVKLELVGGAQRNEDAERNKAAVATAQPVAAPVSPEHVVDADLEQLIAELAVAQVVVWHCTRQQLAENLETLFTRICHGIQTGTTTLNVATSALTPRQRKIHVGTR